MNNAASQELGELLAHEGKVRPQVVYEPLYEDAFLPTRATEQSVGLDAYAYLNDREVLYYDEQGIKRHKVTRGLVYLNRGERMVIPLGFKAQLPEGYEAQVRARSSWALKRGLLVPNSPGTIDADYPDEWGVLLFNAGRVSHKIEHGDRIAQIVISSYAAPEWVEGTVGITTDRTGGIGSTG